MGETYLGADLGGTNLRVALVSGSGDVLASFRSATPRQGSADAIAAELVRLARNCIAEKDASPSTFGIAIPALIDSIRQEIIRSPNLPQLDGSSLAEMVAAEMNIPVVLENDANAAAVGESWRGASHGFPNSICMTLGTGIGGGIILDGRLWRGSDGTAGEVGHICVEPLGRECGCGSRGCVEQYASASGIVKNALELREKDPEAGPASQEPITSLELYNSAVAGNSLAREAFRMAGFYLGIAIADLVDILNPDVVVIGGGASNGWDFFIDETWHQVREKAFRRPAERVKIVRAAVGDSAGVIGAAKVASDRPRETAHPNRQLQN